MGTILVVDDSAICREPIVAALKHQGYEAAGAASGEQALERLKEVRPDLIVLDLLMPGIDGWGVLGGLRGLPGGGDVPVVLLTATVDRECVLRARQLGVRDYLLKSQFSLQDLFARVRKYVAGPAPAGAAPRADQGGTGTTSIATQPATAAAPVIATSPPRQLTREAVVKRLEACTQAKTLAGLVAQIIAVASSPRGSVADLVTVLKRDPVLSSRVLQLANSAGFATQKPCVTTVDEAVRNIGVSAVRNIAASVGIFESFSSGGVDGLDLARCWQHSFAVAALMDRLLPQGGPDPDAGGGVAYLVGLCHDLPEIVLRQHFAHEYAAAAELASQMGKPLRQAQAAVFGLGPTELAGLVLSKLGLPAAIITPIQEFARESDSPSTGGTGRLPHALRLANHYAHGLLLASSADAPVSPIARAEYAKYVGKTEPVIDGETLRGEVLAVTSVLARVPASDQASLLQPLLAAVSVRLWYARHPSLSTLDPLGAALGFVAQPQVHDRLPQRPEELAGCGGIVVAAPRPGLAPFGLDAVAVARRASEGRDLPVFYLTPRTEPAAAAGPPAPGGVQIAEYPVSLRALHQFVTSLR